MKINLNRVKDQLNTNLKLGLRTELFLISTLFAIAFSLMGVILVQINTQHQHQQQHQCQPQELKETQK